MVKLKEVREVNVHLVSKFSLYVCIGLDYTLPIKATKVYLTLSSIKCSPMAHHTSFTDYYSPFQISTRAWECAKATFSKFNGKLVPQHVCVHTNR